MPIPSDFMVSLPHSQAERKEGETVPRRHPAFADKELLKKYDGNVSTMYECFQQAVKTFGTCVLDNSCTNFL